MIFDIVIENIQHIKSLVFNIDLSSPQLKCVVGKNSAGKTTLIRAIRNLKYTTTFQQTASPLIFNSLSKITYSIDGQHYRFEYNTQLRAIDSKDAIDRTFTNSMFVELPIPYGERFSQYKRLSEIDGVLRRNISIENFDAPSELIEFLHRIYRSNRFSNLKETIIKKKKYYFLLLKDDFYVREDYFSSGEYFIINLFRMIKSKCKLIVIDEIDISLDASAQVNLIEELRRYSQAEGIKIVFTTHSLPLLKTLRTDEIHFLEHDNGVAKLFNVSYNYVKSALFGFYGWDKYVLTEDTLLQKYLIHLIADDQRLRHSRYIILYVGGGGNVVKLMRQNSNDGFFSSPQNVLSILDGDQRAQQNGVPQVEFIPFVNIEHQVDLMHREKIEHGGWGFPDVGKHNGPKDLYHRLINVAHVPEEKIFDFINNNNQDAVARFRSMLLEFLLAAT